MIEHVLLGDNPFIGVNHLSQASTRQKPVVSDAKKIASVMESAFANGAEGLVCSAHAEIKNTLGYLKAQHYGRAFELHVIVPDAQSYVRIASEKGMLGLLSETLGKLSFGSRMKAAIKGGTSALTLDPIGMMNAYLDMECSLFRSIVPPGAKVSSLFLHELITELIVSFKLDRLAKSYIAHARGTLHVAPGFVTRNFQKFVDFALEAGLPLNEFSIMTPFNKAGFQMNPSRSACEESLSRVPDTDVIAMSILASGYLGLADGIAYIKDLPRRVSVVVGVSTQLHASETFSYLKVHQVE